MNSGTALTLAPWLPFQVLLHVLFEHAVGYALLALKEVEEISLLLPQVGGSGGLAGRTTAPRAAGPRHAPRAPTWPVALWGGALGLKAPDLAVGGCVGGGEGPYLRS